MKKQTKLVATLSTAALLALGFSAVSMAAGWDNSTGAWRYLNNDGTEVVDEWKSANGNWFYLDSDGVMATDKLIEDESSTKGTKYYYVDQYGAMVKNTWKAVAMDDDDDSNLDAEYWWYYFGNDGKAYTIKSDNKITKNQLKTINGLKYAFDEEGHMLYGWTSAAAGDHSQQDDDDKAWQTATYYFNGWNDGHAQTGWAQIAVTDNDDETQNYWFYFNGDGEKQAKKRKKINGVYYVFAEDGHMIDEWAIKNEDGTWSEFTDDNGDTKATRSVAANNVAYLNGDGSQRKNTWVWAIPDEKWINSDYEDDQYRWFYFGKDGKLTVNKTKKINGKTYAFDTYGRMLTDFVEVGSDVKKIAGHDDYTADQWIKNKNDENKSIHGDVVYYFSSDEDKDGSRKTGYQNIELADDTYQFYFQSNGEGKTQFDSKIKKFTVAGLVIKPSNDDDNNYAALTGVTYKSKDKYDVSNNVKVYTSYDDMKKTVGSGILVNKQGAIVKGKTVRDENDQYWLTNDKGEIINCAPDKDAYDLMKKNSEWK